jgi:hypothetical protein
LKALSIVQVDEPDDVVLVHHGTLIDETVHQFVCVADGNAVLRDAEHSDDRPAKIADLLHADAVGVTEAMGVEASHEVAGELPGVVDVPREGSVADGTEVLGARAGWAPTERVIPVGCLIPADRGSPIVDGERRAVRIRGDDGPQIEHRARTIREPGVSLVVDDAAARRGPGGVDVVDEARGAAGE